MNSVQVIFVLLATISVVLGIRIKENGAYSGLSSGRIIGGRDAELGEATYQVSLQNEWHGEFSHFCGGAIIGEDSIATAAHCVMGMNPSVLRVITGTLKWKSPGKIYYVESIETHCNYDKPLYNNDIAILTLNSSIEFNEYTTSIELNTDDLKEGDDIILSGWGSTVLWGETPNHLQIINLKYVPHKKCFEAHNNTSDVGIGHLCTYSKDGEGACHGDSGGPYVHNNKLVALVNWGEPCAKGKPDVNAKISYYHDFITRSMRGCNKW